MGSSYRKLKFMYLILLESNKIDIEFFRMELSGIINWIPKDFSGYWPKRKFFCISPSI
jgi:hypothetical protein